MRLLRGLLIVGAVVGPIVLAPTAAQAACHAFTVTATPSVTEGGPATVTVARDGSSGPSNITVSTVDGTASAGSDYTAVTKTINFTTETSQSFAVSTINDSAVESDETFLLHLSNPGGCSANPNYSVGPDATVTIKDNDTAATTTSLKATTTSLKATTSSSSTSSTVRRPTTSSSSSSSSSSSTTSTTIKPASKSSSNTPLLIAGIVLVLVALGATAYALNRRGGFGRRPGV